MTAVSFWKTANVWTCGQCGGPNGFQHQRCVWCINPPERPPADAVAAP